MQQRLLELLKNLPPRPRLLINAGDIERMRSLAKTDPLFPKLQALAVHRAEEFLLAPLPERIMEGRRLLGVSRTVMNAVFSLGLSFLLTEDQRFSRRAIDTMLAAAAFSDWNPSHFLDVGEMTLALGAGFDWLHDRMSDDERDAISTAIIEKGLKPGAAVEKWWVDGTNNWNPVCHAGLSYGAIAVAERDPELAAFTLRRAIENVPRVGGAYAPDGAYDEGSMYWGYGTTFLVLLMAALDRAFGTTFDLDKMPGLIESARYMKHVIGPTGINFNYSDNREGRYLQPALLWFADHCNDPSLAAGEVELLRDLPSPGLKRLLPGEVDRFVSLIPIWYRPAGSDSNSTTPLTWHGQGKTPVAMMRTGWNSNATFVAIKGGSPGVSHAHMDVGSFVLDAGGVRWIKDLGMQDYHSLESAGVRMWDNKQGGERWKVFRIGPETHSILRFGTDEQLVDQSATLTFTEPLGTIGQATIDLTTVSGPAVASAIRKITLRNDATIELEDKWTLASSTTVTSQFITDAEVTVGPRRVIMRKNGQTLMIDFDTSDTAFGIHVDDLSTGPVATDEANPGSKRIRLQSKSEAGTVGFHLCRFSFG